MSRFEFVAMVVAIVVAIALADGVKLWAYRGIEFTWEHPRQ